MHLNLGKMNIVNDHRTIKKIEMMSRAIFDWPALARSLNESHIDVLYSFDSSS